MTEQITVVKNQHEELGRMAEMQMVLDRAAKIIHGAESMEEESKLQRLHD